MFRPTIAPLFHVLILLGLFHYVTTSYKTGTIVDICSLLGDVFNVHRELPRAGRSDPKHDGRTAGPCSLYFFAPPLRS